MAMLLKGAEVAKALTEEPVSYTHLDVYKRQDQYVEITGYLGTIDSSGKYIGVGAKSDDYNYFLDEVLCYIKNDDQLNQIAAMSKDDSITLRGKITNVGEVMGYTLDIDSIG